MPTDLIRTSNGIREKGGKQWAYIRVDATGSVANSDTWHDGVYRQKSKFEFEQSLTPVLDESGQQVASITGDIKSSFVITSLQDDTNLEQFLTQETEDSYFAIIAAAGDNDNSNNKLRFFPITRIQRKYSVDAPGRKPEITIIPQYNENAVTPTTKPSWVSVTTGSLSVPAGQYYSVVTQSGSAIL